MFAYCLNNPVNRIDACGDVSLWFYLLVDHDMGFIHRMVQAHIRVTYGANYSTEMSLSGFGRADIVNTVTGHVWEVKHAGQFPSARAAIATAQATAYIGGTNGSTTITGLGEAGAFTGYFYIQCMNECYLVNYETPQKGAVLYSVKRVENCSESPFRVYVPKKQKESSKGKAVWGLIGFAGAGRGFHSYEDIARDMAYTY